MRLAKPWQSTLKAAYSLAKIEKRKYHDQQNLAPFCLLILLTSQRQSAPTSRAFKLHKNKQFTKAALNDVY